MTAIQNQWYLSSSRGTVLFHIAANPQCTTRDIAGAMFITQRTVWKVIGDLRRARMLRVRKNGRRNHYTVNLDAPFLHPTLTGYTLRSILGHVVGHAPSSLAVQIDADGGR